MIKKPEKFVDNPEYSGILENIKMNILSESEIILFEKLVEEDQAHLFKDWDSPGKNDREKKIFFDKLLSIDAVYPGGLVEYIRRSRELLDKAKNGENPYAGFTPGKPETINLLELNNKYLEYEEIGMRHLDKIGFVLVAGGMGERLGYPGIKLDIPFESICLTTYLEYYSAFIKSLERRAGEGSSIPLIIMTSEKTNSRTVAVLKENNNFGLEDKQIFILLQKLVPALSDNEAHIALEEKYEIIYKPHGHGDIHMLIHSTGTAKRLYEKGTRHLVFFQDTNAQALNSVIPAFGVSILNNYDFNSIAVQRIPGEAAGGIASLKKGGITQTVNVEYNQLDSLLRETVSPRGDVADETGYSIFPGNINLLIIKMESYLKILEKSGGIISEFVNPKYLDEKRKKFKKPARLETMMQDLPRLFGSAERVGVTLFERRWCFSANKNNMRDAREKYESKRPPESAASAESDFFYTGRKKCEFAGMKVYGGSKKMIQGIPFVNGSIVVLFPSFAVSLNEVKKKIKGGTIGKDSVLFLDGEGIRLENVSIADYSALIVRSVPGARVAIKNLTIKNEGFRQVLLSEEDFNSPDIPEYYKIRGYRFKNIGAEIYEFSEPGDYVIHKTATGADGYKDNNR